MTETQKPMMVTLKFIQKGEDTGSIHLIAFDNSGPYDESTDSFCIRSFYIDEPGRFVQEAKEWMMKCGVKEEDAIVTTSILSNTIRAFVEAMIRRGEAVVEGAWENENKG